MRAKSDGEFHIVLHFFVQVRYAKRKFVYKWEINYLQPHDSALIPGHSCMTNVSFRCMYRTLTGVSSWGAQHGGGTRSGFSFAARLCIYECLVVLYCPLSGK